MNYKENRLKLASVMPLYPKTAIKKGVFYRIKLNTKITKIHDKFTLVFL